MPSTQGSPCPTSCASLGRRGRPQRLGPEVSGVPRAPSARRLVAKDSRDCLLDPPQAARGWSGSWEGSRGGGVRRSVWDWPDLWDLSPVEEGKQGAPRKRGALEFVVELVLPDTQGRAHGSTQPSPLSEAGIHLPWSFPPLVAQETGEQGALRG